MTTNLGLTVRDEATSSDGLALVDLLDVTQPREYSYAELYRMADSVAVFITQQGIGRGQRVGILGANSAYFVTALLGIMRTGVVAVPINFKFPDETINFICKDAELVLVFCDNDQAPRLTPDIPTIGLDGSTFAGFTSAEGYDLLQPSDNEPALVLYTSGSTGQPKGVLLSHASQRSMIDALGTRVANLSGIVAAPLYHMNGLLYSFMLFDQRGTVVLMPRFDPVLYLQAIDKYGINLVSGVPTMLSLMARQQPLIAQLNLETVLSVQVGSAPLSETVVGQAREMFPNARIGNGYGTTEAGAGMFGDHPEGIPTPIMSLGYPAAHVKVRLKGGRDDEGVLIVKSPAAMNRYINLPEKTAEKMTAEGWIDTGDIMRRDEQGFYYFVGRNDDMFVCNGENIYPGQVERLLERDPRVAEACVVARSDETRGHIPVAFIVKSLGSNLNPDIVKQIALSGAPPYMHPRLVIFLDEMPLAGTNKIDRKLLQDKAARTT